MSWFKDFKLDWFGKKKYDNLVKEIEELKKVLKEKIDLLIRNLSRMERRIKKLEMELPNITELLNGLLDKQFEQEI